jgi:hypothetical protein
MAPCGELPVVSATKLGCGLSPQSISPPHPPPPILMLNSLGVLFVHFFPSLCFWCSFVSKYGPQHFVLQHLHFFVILLVRQTQVSVNYLKFILVLFGFSRCYDE